MANLLRLTPLLLALTLLVGLPVAVSGQGQVTVQFERDEFGSDDVRVVEGNTTVDVTMTLSQALQNSFDIGVRTRDGSAQAGSDYQAIASTVTFSPDSTSETVSIAIQDDSDNEGDEHFFVELHSPSDSSVSIADDSAWVNITNDDFVAIQLESSTYTTNEAGPTSFDVRAVMTQGTIKQHHFCTTGFPTTAQRCLDRTTTESLPILLSSPVRQPRRLPPYPYTTTE